MNAENIQGSGIPQTKDTMDVQCSQCGMIQSFDETDSICQKCGNSLSTEDTLIVKNPRKGRGLVASGILMFLCFFSIFLFYSKFFGGWGMAVSALFYLWGIYKVHLNKKISAAENVNQRKL